MDDHASDPPDLRVDRLSRTVARIDALLRTLEPRLDAAEQGIDRLDQYSVEQAEVLSELLPRVDRLAGALDGLGARSGAMTGDGQAARPVVWALLSAEEATAQWDELARWVDTVAIPTLAPTVRQIPPCWPMHSWGRETMSWLHHAHVQAYGPSGSIFQVAEWHTGWVAQAFAAFSAPDAAPGGYCSDNEHNLDQVERVGPLRTRDWGPWLVRARDQDVASRRTG